MKKLLATVFILSALLFLPGCNMAQVEEFKRGLATSHEYAQRVEHSLDEALEHKAQLKAIIDSLPEGERRAQLIELYNKVDLYASETREKLAIANERVAAYRKAIEDATEPHELISGGMTTVAPLLPPPFNGLVGAGASVVALIGSFLAGRKKEKRDAAKIVHSIDRARAGGDLVDLNDLRDVMPESTREYVRRLRREKD